MYSEETTAGDRFIFNKKRSYFFRKFTLSFSTLQSNEKLINKHEKLMENWKILGVLEGIFVALVWIEKLQFSNFFFKEKIFERERLNFKRDT